jgi:hypothetical protein
MSATFENSVIRLLFRIVDAQCAVTETGRTLAFQKLRRDMEDIFGLRWLLHPEDEKQ